MGAKKYGLSLLLGSWLLLYVGVTFADTATDLYAFQTVQQQQQFIKLTQQLRCLVCQNENLADSDAPLAADLRLEIAGMIRAGQNNQTITNYMVKRYGNFVRYQPPFNALTWFLWLIPPILLLVGFVIIWRMTNSSRKR